MKLSTLPIAGKVAIDLRRNRGGNAVLNVPLIRALIQSTTIDQKGRLGDARKITLPNSGITVRTSIFYWQKWHPMDDRDVTTPQIAAPLTFDAYRNNVDPALEAIQRATTVTSPR